MTRYSYHPASVSLSSFSLTVNNTTYGILKTQASSNTRRVHNRKQNAKNISSKQSALNPKKSPCHCPSPYKHFTVSMGNAISVRTQNYFYTSCMAKYANITKPQVMAIRNLLVLLSQQQPSGKTSKNTNHSSPSPTSSADEGPIMIQRKHLKRAIQKVNLTKDPDHDIIDLIFTMWCTFHDSANDDVSGNLDTGVVSERNKKSSRSDQVPWYEFLISISLLACKTDTFEQSIRFTLYVVHRNHFYNSSSNSGNNSTSSKYKSQQGYISSTDAISFLQGTVCYICKIKMLACID